MSQMVHCKVNALHSLLDRGGALRNGFGVARSNHVHKLDTLHMTGSFDVLVVVGGTEVHPAARSVTALLQARGTVDGNRELSEKRVRSERPRVIFR